MSLGLVAAYTASPFLLLGVPSIHSLLCEQKQSSPPNSFSATWDLHSPRHFKHVPRPFERPRTSIPAFTGRLWRFTFCTISQSSLSPSSINGQIMTPESLNAISLPLSGTTLQLSRPYVSPFEATCTSSSRRGIACSCTKEAHTGSAIQNLTVENHLVCLAIS